MTEWIKIEKNNLPDFETNVLLLIQKYDGLHPDEWDNPEDEFVCSFGYRAKAPWTNEIRWFIHVEEEKGYEECVVAWAETPSFSEFERD